MSRYVDAEDALKDADTIDPKYSNLIKRVKDIIKAQPSADVVEVVRCKDCKHWTGIECTARDIDVVDDDDYCSYGERKDKSS